MTPEERAEKIAPLDESKPLPIRGRGELRELIAAQIEEAVRETELNILGHSYRTVSRVDIEKAFPETMKEIWDEGFATAREKAVLIADEYNSHQHYHPEIAEAIRAMEPDK